MESLEIYLSSFLSCLFLTLIWNLGIISGILVLYSSEEYYIQYNPHLNGTSTIYTLILVFQFSLLVSNCVGIFLSFKVWKFTINISLSNINLKYGFIIWLCIWISSLFGILVISLFGFIKGKESNGQLGFMFEMFIKNSGKAQFVATFMTFQTQHNCCGINGPNDWITAGASSTIQNCAAQARLINIEGCGQKILLEVNSDVILYCGLTIGELISGILAGLLAWFGLLHQIEKALLKNSFINLEELSQDLTILDDNDNNWTQGIKSRSTATGASAGSNVPIKHTISYYDTDGKHHVLEYTNSTSFSVNISTNEEFGYEVINNDNEQRFQENLTLGSKSTGTEKSGVISKKDNSNINGSLELEKLPPHLSQAQGQGRNLEPMPIFDAPVPSQPANSQSPVVQIEYITKSQLLNHRFKKNEPANENKSSFKVSRYKVHGSNPSQGTSTSTGQASSSAAYSGSTFQSGSSNSRGNSGYSASSGFPYSQPSSSGSTGYGSSLSYNSSYGTSSRGFEPSNQSQFTQLSYPYSSSTSNPTTSHYSSNYYHEMPTSSQQQQPTVQSIFRRGNQFNDDSFYSKMIRNPFLHDNPNHHHRDHSKHETRAEKRFNEVIEKEENVILDEVVHGGKVIGEIHVEHKFDPDGTPIKDENQKPKATLTIIRNKHVKDPPPPPPGHHGQTGHLAEDIFEMSGQKVHKKFKSKLKDFVIPEFQGKKAKKNNKDLPARRVGTMKKKFGSVTGSNAQFDLEALISPSKLRKEREDEEKKKEEEAELVHPTILVEKRQHFNQGQGIDHHHPYQQQHQPYINYTPGVIGVRYTGFPEQQQQRHQNHQEYLHAGLYDEPSYHLSRVTGQNLQDSHGFSGYDHRNHQSYSYDNVNRSHGRSHGRGYLDYDRENSLASREEENEGRRNSRFHNGHSSYDHEARHSTSEAHHYHHRDSRE